MRQLTVRRTAVLGLALALAASVGACGVKSSNDVASGTTSATTAATAPDKTTTTADATTTSADETTTTEDETTTTAATSTTSGGGGSGERVYTARLAAALVSKDQGDLPITGAQSGCLAPRWVAILGYDKLVKMGVTPEQLGTGNGADTSTALDELIGRPEARKLVAAFGLCGINLQQVFVDSIGADSGLTDAQKTCLVGKLPKGYVDQLLVISLADGAAALSADTQLSATLTNAAQACK